MTAPPWSPPARLDADHVGRVVDLLSGPEGASDPTTLAHQQLLDALDRGEQERFWIWPADRPLGVLYVAHGGTLVPAGSPEAGPPLAGAAEQTGWRVILGDAGICRDLLEAMSPSAFRRRTNVREQRLMATVEGADSPWPTGLRRATRADADTLTEFACQLHVEDRMGPPVPRSAQNAVRSRVLDGVTSGRTWVVERRGRPVAKVDVSLHSRRRGAQLSGIYVDDRWRGRGIAGEVVGALAASLLADGLPGVTLHVRADNTPALAAYARAGFHDVMPWLLALR